MQTRPTEQQVENARRVVADYLRPTPTVEIAVGERPTWAKLEDLQVTGSFKLRGALAALSATQRLDANTAVITSSAGNHGLGIAHASMLLGVRATVVVPANASPVKVNKLRGYDIELIQHGQSYDEAQTHARALAAERSLRYVSPFNDLDVIAGQSTCFDEFFAQVPSMEHLVISVGGGGLISGAVVARANAGLEHIAITGVQSAASASMYAFLRGDDLANVVHEATIADGLAGGVDPGSFTNEILLENKIKVVTVPESEIRTCVRLGVEKNGLVMEGSAAASYAAIATDAIADTQRRVGFVVSGRNIARELLVAILNEG